MFWKQWGTHTLSPIVNHLWKKSKILILNLSRCLCIVMDYADGGDLYAKIAK